MQKARPCQGRTRSARMWQSTSFKSRASMCWSPCTPKSQTTRVNVSESMLLSPLLKSQSKRRPRWPQAGSAPCQTASQRATWTKLRRSSPPTFENCAKTAAGDQARAQLGGLRTQMGLAEVFSIGIKAGVEPLARGARPRSAAWWRPRARVTRTYSRGVCQ